ncbi:MAG: amino acid permease [Candidatus Methanomethylicus sp.]|nr:amino acid permease [Candidatus Methanomethylicus sp.]
MEQKESIQPQSLKREIGLAGAISYGVGVIVGAGIYALVGRVAGYSGNAIWISFLLGAVLASFTGLSYAELSRLLPTAGAEYDYILEASRRKFLAFIVGWLVVLTGAISAAAVALGFSGYLKVYLGLPDAMMATILVLALSTVSFWGIKESIWLNAAFTAIEVLGLVMVIAIGIPFMGTVNYFEYPSGFQGIIAATALVFFAYLGFEGIVKIGEETKDPERTIPRAIMASIIITTALYALVGIAAVSVIPYQQLAASTSPIADIALKAQGQELFVVLSGISLIATTNTVLVLLIATSRIIYGVAKSVSITFLSKVHPKKGTPFGAIMVTAALTIPFTFLGDIELVANVTNFLTFVVFLAVNLTVLVLVQRGACCRGPLRHFSVRRLPLIAILGVASSLLMLFQYSLEVVAISFLMVGLGAIIFRVILK